MMQHYCRSVLADRIAAGKRGQAVTKLIQEKAIYTNAIPNQAL